MGKSKRFRVEFLRETTEALSVCHARSVRARDLKLAHFQAQAWAQAAMKEHGAEGFQIRWVDDSNRIVFVETFDHEQPASLH